jgi:hypothetical protein
LDLILQRTFEYVCNLFARVPVPAKRRFRIELDPHLDDLTSGDAEIVPLELGAPDARLLRQGQVQRQTAPDQQRHTACDSGRLHVDPFPG